MGNNTSSPMQSMSREITCTDNLMCQNIDSSRSVPGQDPVLVCPNATCQAGRCVCGLGCTRDPYTGICCKRVEERSSPNGQKTTFCVESDVASSDEVPKGLLESFSGLESFGVW